MTSASRDVGVLSRRLETPFRKQDMMNFQIQLTKRQGVVPMTRDYIAHEEARLRALEGSASRS